MRVKVRAFTLVELLVVVAIIVVLLALLVPAMGKAFMAANRGKCASNLDGVGTAVATSLNDSPTRLYPAAPNDAAAPNGPSWLMLGNLGTEYNDPNVHDVPSRPLNKYLGFTAKGGAVGVAECPGDRGDGTAVSKEPVYQRLGCSYVTPANKNSTAYYGIGNVFGGKEAPILAGSVSPQSSKVLFADTPVFPDRSLSVPADNTNVNRWHYNDSKERRVNALFADGHVDWFTFEYPAAIEMDPTAQTSRDYPENASSKFW